MECLCDLQKLLTGLAFYTSLIFYSSQCTPTGSHPEYMSLRSKLLLEESTMVIGGDLVLTGKEKAVDEILLAAKREEFDKGFHETFLPSVSFLSSKDKIERSPVFEIIRHMPKGGILHSHESIVDIPWIIEHITYKPHLFYCLGGDDFAPLHFKFLLHAPKETEACATDWKLVEDARREMGPLIFDRMLYHKMTMYNDSGNHYYENGTMAWDRFEHALRSSVDLYFNIIVFEDFVRRALEELVEDNVQYLELRTLLLPIQELDGTVHSPEHTLQQYIQIIEAFTKENQDRFVGVKLIYHSLRVPVNQQRIFNEVNEAVKFRAKYPEYFAGYDLVCQEDLGGPLIDYLDSLLYSSEYGIDLPFFFHAGETNWQGTSVDENLVDALLLNTSRIAHGYAINKHPVVMEMFKEKGIAIEINPISNQVLGLVKDLRNHVGVSLIAEGHHVVISSDDSAVWGALPLSHDFYMAFMGMSSRNIGLSLLKQLALNSFKYSAMNDAEKEAAISLWQAKWDKFIDEILERYGRHGGPIPDSKDKSIAQKQRQEL